MKETPPIRTRREDDWESAPTHHQPVNLFKSENLRQIHSKKCITCGKEQSAGIKECPRCGFSTILK